MSPVEPIADPYTACRDAIDFLENDGLLAIVPLEFIRYLAPTVDDFIKHSHRATMDMDTADRDAEMLRIDSQFDLPEFRTYVLARIYGAM